MALPANRRSVITLYSEANNPYCQRVRIVLAEKGVNYEQIDVSTSPKSLDELAEYNPHCHIPTLVDRDLVLYESEIIMEYLDERFPHPPLMPIYPVARGRSRLMIHRINQDWYRLMMGLLSPDEPESSKITWRQELLDSINSVIAIFADSEMPFFLSEEFSLVDCCIAPLLWRLPSLGVELPPQAQPVLDYAERIFKRDSFQSSLTDAERLIRL